MPASVGSAYHIAHAGRTQAAAVFEMPQKFRDMGMPSFWMSYVAVDDAARAVDVATAAGGKVEVGPMEFDATSRIALIRDPLGAGFTVHEGQGLAPRAEKPAPGQMAWNALYVSDAGAVRDFYRRIFGWEIAVEPGPDRVLPVRLGGRTVARVHENSEEIRGTFEFWGVRFAVADLRIAREAILSAGGSVLYEMPGPWGSGPILMADADGAAFFAVDAVQ